ncbi:hypothetical protein [Xylanibacter rodentium]|uniref:hypothetical protein n=1 Tax=Xylanibacter rodentium TaxID=2736289 RepID=UPI00256F58DE|nr:hypothetical protein [Xylanibacter rodentium]
MEYRVSTARIVSVSSLFAPEATATILLMSSYGRLDYYNENPTRKHDASQRNVVAQAQERRQSQGQGQQNRKPKGQSVG